MGKNPSKTAVYQIDSLRVLSRPLAFVDEDEGTETDVGEEMGVQDDLPIRCSLLRRLPLPRRTCGDAVCEEFYVALSEPCCVRCRDSEDLRDEVSRGVVVVEKGRRRKGFKHLR
jgi:hypothetical protein